MGLFGTSSSQNFDTDIEKATSEINVGEKWDVIMNICDKVGGDSANAKECLKLIIKRLNHNDPHVVLQAITLLDACVSNCGKVFHLEIASREFEKEFIKLLGKPQPKITKKLRLCLKSWAENYFKTDPQLNLIPSLYHKLKHDGHDFESDPVIVPKKEIALSKEQQEQEDLAKAIEMSLKETKASPRASGSSEPSSSLYPSTMLSSAPVQEPRKVRALYDFEAAEDNELTFTAGEVLLVLDDTDPNWWKGQNHRGEGLFPSNFVSADLSAEPEDLNNKNKKTVQFSDEENSKNESFKKEQPNVIEINEEKIDRLLHLLHEADPEDPSQDSEEMLQLENQVNQMGPLIDAELERVDRKHAQLTQLSSDLVDAINLYHTLMREPDRSSMMMGGPMPSFGMGGYPGQQQQQPPPMFNLPGVFTHQMPNMYQMQQNMAGPPPNSLPPYGMPQLRNDMSQMNMSSMPPYSMPQPHTQPQQQSQVSQSMPPPSLQTTTQTGPTSLQQHNSGLASLPPQMQLSQQMPQPQQQQQQMPNMTVQSMVGPQTTSTQNMMNNMPPPHMQSVHHPAFNSLPHQQQQQQQQRPPQQQQQQPYQSMPPQQQHQQTGMIPHIPQNYTPQMPFNAMPPMPNVGGMQFPIGGNMNMMQQPPLANTNSPQNIPIYQQQR